MGLVDIDIVGKNGGNESDTPDGEHDRSERPTVERGSLHKRADGLQILGGPISVHAMHFALQSECVKSVFRF